MTIDAPMILNRDCYCRPISRQNIISEILGQQAAPNMDMMLADRHHYFANTSVFLSELHKTEMINQIQAIESVVDLPAYTRDVENRCRENQGRFKNHPTKGVFMGYDFHITEDGPKLIEINSNAGGAFIVNMIEKASNSSSGSFDTRVMDMFQAEWASTGRMGKFKTLAIVDEAPHEQFHFPDMCLAKSLFEAQGIAVVIADPSNLHLKDGKVFHGDLQIDLIYNRLTDFDLSQPENEIILQAYEENLTVVTPAPHHHALYADKRNLITLSDREKLTSFGASSKQIALLKPVPKAAAVTEAVSDQMWQNRRALFFKPEAGYGSKGAFRGGKLTRKVWADILQGGYIAQDRILPSLRAVTVGGARISLKFDLRVYTYDGEPLLFAARVYRGQTTNLRTAGGGLAAVLSIPENCLDDVNLGGSFDACPDLV